jgi:antitoxin component HigA of HigAB toxin-antitoxin module
MMPAKTDTEAYWNRVRFMPEMVATPLSYLMKAFPLDMSQYPNLFQSTRKVIRVMHKKTKKVLPNFRALRKTRTE